MNELTTFKNPVFGKLPCLVVEGIEYFGATEAARALSFGNPWDAVKNHVDLDDLADYEVIDSLGRIQNKKFVNESGLYSLIFGASKQGNNKDIQLKAKRFKRWVTSEVLPTIRKTGSYTSVPQTFAEALRLAADLEEQKQQLELENQTMKPKALFADAVSGSSNSILIGELAKLISQNGVEIGQNRLFSWLRHNGYLISRKGESFNMPTQKSMELGIMEIKERAITDGDGLSRLTRTPKITGKGQTYFVNKFLEKEEVS